MTDIHETAFCSVCGEPTVHQRLAQNRGECTDCHETRELGPNQMWDPAAPAPTCPTCGGLGAVPPSMTHCLTCNGDGWVRIDDLPRPEGETS